VVAIAFFGLLEVDGNPAGLILWGLFGTTNQILAGIVLLSVTIYLLKTGRPIYYTLIPMILMLSMALWAMILNLKDFWDKGNKPLLIVGSIILFMIVWFISEGVIIFKRTLNSKEVAFKSEPK